MQIINPGVQGFADPYPTKDLNLTGLYAAGLERQRTDDSKMAGELIRQWEAQWGDKIHLLANMPDDDPAKQAAISGLDRALWTWDRATGGMRSVQDLVGFRNSLLASGAQGALNPAQWGQVLNQTGPSTGSETVPAPAPTPAPVVGQVAPGGATGKGGEPPVGQKKAPDLFNSQLPGIQAAQAITDPRTPAKTLYRIVTDPGYSDQTREAARKAFLRKTDEILGIDKGSGLVSDWIERRQQANARATLADTTDTAFVAATEAAANSSELAQAVGKGFTGSVVTIDPSIAAAARASAMSESPTGRALEPPNMAVAKADPATLDDEALLAMYNLTKDEKYRQEMARRLKPEAPVAQGRYRVVAGDTLSKIADKAGIELTALLEVNPQIVNPNKISVGQELVLPALSTGPATAGPATAAPAASSPTSVPLGDEIPPGGLEGQVPLPHAFWDTPVPISTAPIEPLRNISGSQMRFAQAGVGDMRSGPLGPATQTAIQYARTLDQVSAPLEVLAQASAKGDPRASELLVAALNEQGYSASDMAETFRLGMLDNESARIREAQAQAGVTYTAPTGAVSPDVLADQAPREVSASKLRDLLKMSSVEDLKAWQQDPARIPASIRGLAESYASDWGPEQISELILTNISSELGSRAGAMPERIKSEAQVRGELLNDRQLRALTQERTSYQSPGRATLATEAQNRAALAKLSSAGKALADVSQKVLDVSASALKKGATLGMDVMDSLGRRSQLAEQDFIEQARKVGTGFAAVSQADRDAMLAKLKQMGPKELALRGYTAAAEVAYNEEKLDQALKTAVANAAEKADKTAQTEYLKNLENTRKYTQNVRETMLNEVQNNPMFKEVKAAKNTDELKNLFSDKKDGDTRYQLWLRYQRLTGGPLYEFKRGGLLKASSFVPVPNIALQSWVTSKGLGAYRSAAEIDAEYDKLKLGVTSTVNINGNQLQGASVDLGAESVDSFLDRQLNQ